MLEGESKRCSRCNEAKPLSAFHKNHKARDGHNHLCRPCAAIVRAEWYRANRERILTRQAQTRNRERDSEYGTRQRKRFQQTESGRARLRAHRRLKDLRYQGKLIPPAVCSRCDKPPVRGYIEAHHPNGYEGDSWKDILWLCPYCHAAEHKKPAAMYNVSTHTCGKGGRHE